ncbi:hypothetical protein ACF0H5_010945 [Mactra antiquata]
MATLRTIRIALAKWTHSIINGDFSCVSAVFSLVLIIFLCSVLFSVKRSPTVITSLANTRVDWNDLEKNSVNTILIEHEDGQMYVAFKLNISAKIMRDMQKGKLTIGDAASLSKFTSMPSSSGQNNAKKAASADVTTANSKVEESRKNSGSEAIPGFVYPVTIHENPYNINNPKVCSDEKQLSIIVVVHSSTTHFMRRSSIRETWANYKLYQGHSLRIVFLLGMPTKSTTQTLIEHESSLHNDIIQGNFLDSYRNLTHKGVLGLRWVTENCRHARFVLKVDDDVFVNVFKVMEKIDIDFKNKTRRIWCPVRYNGTSTIQRDKGKWMVDNNEFKNMTHFPVTYCNGFFTIISSDIIPEMYKAATVTRFFWIDDVYLFGLLPFKIGNVSHSPLMNLNLDERKAVECFESNEKQCEMIVANAHTEGIMDKFWYGAVKQYKTLAKKYASDYLVL